MNKIKVYLLFLFTVVFSLVSWAPVYAVTVSQDITLQTTSGSNITLLANSVFDSMTVGANSFTFTLSGTQSVNLRDSDGQILETNIDGLKGSCDGTNSEITLSASKGLSIEVTIKAFACSSGGGGGGSGGGGGTTSSTQTTTTTTTTTTTAASTSTTPTTTATTQATSPYLEGAPAPVAPLSDGVVTSTPIPISVPGAAVSGFPGIMQLKRGLDVGSTGADVKALQEALASMTDIYPEGTVSGFYGSLTKAAVGRFQMKYGLVFSANDPGYGYVGPKTRAKLQEVFGNGAVASTPAPKVSSAGGTAITHELGFGAKGDDVIQLQAFLAGDLALYPEGKITGYYGSLTVAAVKRFQAKYGISQIGRVGPQTLAKLNEVMGKSMSAPQAPASIQDDEAAKKADLQKQITDLQALIESLTKQVQTAQ